MQEVCVKVCLLTFHLSNSCSDVQPCLIADWIKQDIVIGRADLKLYIDTALLADHTKTNQNKSKQKLTCVFLIGSSEFNIQYIYVGIVPFESQDYSLECRIEFFTKLVRIRQFSCKFRHDKCFLPTYTQKKKATLYSGVNLILMTESSD